MYGPSQFFFYRVGILIVAFWSWHRKSCNFTR
jgi:hypothetical protein